MYKVNFKKQVSIFLVIALVVILSFSLTACSLPFTKSSSTASNNTHQIQNTSNTSNDLNNNAAASTAGNISTNSNQNNVNANNNPSAGNIQQNQSLPKLTIPGTMLKPGETWYDAGSEITLNDVSFANGNLQGVEFSLIYKNNKGNDISFSYGIGSNIKVTDNLNKSYKIWGYSNDMMYSDSNFSSTKVTQIVPNGQEANLCNSYPFFLGAFDIGDTKIKQIVITVTDISNVKKAQWAIPVYH